MKTNEQEVANEVDRELSTVIRNMTEQHGDGKFMISDLQNVRHKDRGNMPIPVKVCCLPSHRQNPCGRDMRPPLATQFVRW